METICIICALKIIKLQFMLQKARAGAGVLGALTIIATKARRLQTSSQTKCLEISPTQYTYLGFLKDPFNKS